MVAYSAPPGYRRQSPVRRPKLDEFVATIDHWLDEDMKVPRKQRHTAKRVFDRLRDECGFTGGHTIIKDYMRERDQRRQEVFVPLSHPPGHAQADFGVAMVVIGGVERKAHFFVLDLPVNLQFPASTRRQRCLDCARKMPTSSVGSTTGLGSSASNSGEFVARGLLRTTRALPGKVEPVFRPEARENKEIERVRDSVKRGHALRQKTTKAKESSRRIVLPCSLTGLNIAIAGAAFRAESPTVQ